MYNLETAENSIIKSPEEFLNTDIKLDSLASASDAQPETDCGTKDTSTASMQTQLVKSKPDGVNSTVKTERMQFLEAQSAKSTKTKKSKSIKKDNNESEIFIMNYIEDELVDKIPKKSVTNSGKKRGRPKKLQNKIAIEQEKLIENVKSKHRKREINLTESSDSELDIPLAKISRKNVHSPIINEQKIDTPDNAPNRNCGGSNSIQPVKPKEEINATSKINVALTINSEETPKRRRGRPRKCDILSSKPLEAEEEIIFTTSRSGRKHKEIDYSLIDEKKSQNDIGESNSKYKYTGNTTVVLKQIFNTFQGKKADDFSHDNVDCRKAGRRTKIKDEQFSDDDGTLICAVCNETIINNQWITHKRKIHYNLAWKKGDPPIDISDYGVIVKIYEKLCKSQGFLKCKKCKEKFFKGKNFMEHLEVCNGVIKADGSVICAICKKEMTKNEWHYHKYREHNNLAWREGDQALNLEDQEVVMRILTQLYKARKPLHCEKCGLQKKSVVGYLSHKSTCQKSEEELEKVKVTCKLCNKKVLPVSMDFHLKTHSKPERMDQILDSSYFDVNVGTSGPRKAAARALNVIKSIKGEFVNTSKYYAEQCDFEDNNWVERELRKQSTNCIFHCNFKTDSVEMLMQHLNSCENKPEQYFICKLCLAWTHEEIDIKTHVKTAHNRVCDDKDAEFANDNEEGQNESDEDKIVEELVKEKQKLRQNRKLLLTGKNVIQKVKPIFLVYPIREQKSLLFYPQAYPWMMNFCGKHYTISNLFESFRNSETQKLLDCDILTEYLPKLHESCDITVKTLHVNETICDLDFRKLELFEVCQFYKGESTIYCGGPITSMAWLPTPFEVETHSQILAVSVLNDPEKDYALSETYLEPCLIQFWNFGAVHWKKEQTFKPFLLFGLAITGPIWHMEWCPSGCLDSNNSRLGLLAVASSDSYAYIYSINNYKEENDRGLIYKGEPLVKLQLEDKTSSYYPTKLSWTKAKGHRYIAVGYSNGIVAIFDLLTTSSLWQNRKEDCQIVLPYVTFQAHASCITAITLCHYENGNRWCFTAGADKVAIYWDLFNMTKQMSNRKYGVSDGQFLTQWPVALCAEDETTFNDNLSAHSFIRPIREALSSEFCCFTYSPSGIKSVSFSDWLNLILHGSNAGEVMGQFCQRMFFNIDKKHLKSSYVKCIFSITKLISKNINDTDERHCRTFEEAKQHYGIVFADYNSDQLTNIPNSKTNDLKKVHVEKFNIYDYPLQAVSKLAANPNAQACTYWAAGYQAGFVRVRQMEFLKHSFNPLVFQNYDFSNTV